MNYQHGGDIYSQEILWDFSVNINPLGTPKGVKEAVRRSASFCACYPDSQCRRLVKKLAQLHQVSQQEILCGNGAADLIFQLAFAEYPARAWVLAPSFSAYEQALTGAKTKVCRFFLRREAGFQLDADCLIGAIKKEMANIQTERSGVFAHLYLCNPNNPTGLAVGQEEVKKLAIFAENYGIRLVVDECFLDFLDKPEGFSMVPCLDEFPHMVILKAFTKLYGMAGLRLGYCLTKDQKLLEKIQKIRQPWPVSLIAQAAGEAALEEQAYLEKTRIVVKEGRKQLMRGLEHLGFWVCPSQANFILFQDLRPGALDEQLYQECRKQKLLLRSCRNFSGLDGSYYRIGVKTAEENKRLLDMLAHG